MEGIYDAALDYTNVFAETEKMEETTIEEKPQELSQYMKRYPSTKPLENP